MPADAQRQLEWRPMAHGAPGDIKADCIDGRRWSVTKTTFEGDVVYFVKLSGHLIDICASIVDAKDTAQERENTRDLFADNAQPSISAFHKSTKRTFS